MFAAVVGHMRVVGLSLLMRIVGVGIGLLSDGTHICLGFSGIKIKRAKRENKALKKVFFVFLIKT